MSNSIRCKTDDYGFYSYLKGHQSDKGTEPQQEITAQTPTYYPYSFSAQSPWDKKDGTKGYRP